MVALTGLWISDVMDQKKNSKSTCVVVICLVLVVAMAAALIYVVAFDGEFMGSQSGL